MLTEPKLSIATKPARPLKACCIRPRRPTQSVAVQATRHWLAPSGTSSTAARSSAAAALVGTEPSSAAHMPQTKEVALLAAQPGRPCLKHCCAPASLQQGNQLSWHRACACHSSSGAGTWHPLQTSHTVDSCPRASARPLHQYPTLLPPEHLTAPSADLHIRPAQSGAQKHTRQLTAWTQPGS
jgi:hypothetical protein